MTEPVPPEQGDDKESVAAVFGAAAPAYDQTGRRFFSLFGERLAELADIRPGQAVLDVACGRGASALPAARLTGPRGRVVAVDVAEGMVDALTRDVRTLGLGNVEAHVMDAEQLELPDHAFDRVLGGFCLFFFPDRERALAEMRRVLRPEGRLALSTWVKTDTGWQWLDDLIDAYLRRAGDVRRLRRSGSVCTESPAGMAALLSRTGFAPAQMTVESTEFTWDTEDEWWASLQAGGKRRSLERIERGLGAAGLAEFEAAARHALRSGRPAGSHGIRQTMSVLYSLTGRSPRAAAERSSPPDGRR